METPAGAKFENKNNFILNQIDVEQQKENAKNQNTLKATQTWLKVWQTWATERKINQKIEKSSMKSSIKCWKCNKQKIAWTYSCFSWLMVARNRLRLVQFWELQSITRTHKSRNVLEFMPFPIFIWLQSPMTSRKHNVRNRSASVARENAKAFLPVFHYSRLCPSLD